jgi:hypothetical protein
MPTLILRPDSNGSENEVYQYPDSGSHYDKVDEEVSDDDTTYLYYDTSLSGPKDEYCFYSDSGLGSATINSVTVYAKVKRYNVGYAGFRLRVKVGGTDYESGVKYATASYTEVSETWTTNPYTGQPWTAEEIDALEAGVRYNGVGNGCLWERCTQIWVVVDYTSGVATYTKTWTTDALFKKLDIPTALSVDTAFQKQDIPKTFGLDAAFQKSFIIQKQIDALFKRFDILKSFAVDARFGALITQTISRQIDVMFKRLDATKTFGLDAYFGAAEAETYMKNFALDAIFAYKVRLPELWLDENGKIVLNISKPYTWVGS